MRLIRPLPVRLTLRTSSRTAAPVLRGLALAALAALALSVAPDTLASPGARAPGLPDARPVQFALHGAGTPKSELRRLVGTVVEVRTVAVQGAETARALGERRSGSGAILDPTTVLTIGYLLLEVDQVEVVTTSGKTIPGRVAAYDHQSGLGIVRTVLPLDGTILELGDSDAVSERTRVLTLGHGEPEATELVVVSRKPFAGSWEYLVDRAIYTFPPVNNWSGAALMTGDGRLIGVGSLVVNDAASGGEPVPGNMFVPVNLIKPILSELIEKGRRSGPAQPWLGVNTEAVRGNLMVSRVSRNGPADRAGLAPGDIIVSVGAARVGDQAEFYRQVWKTGPAGAEIPLRVLQAGEIREIRVRSIDRADFLRKPEGV
jgi:serine protease Do